MPTITLTQLQSCYTMPEHVLQHNALHMPMQTPRVHDSCPAIAVVIVVVIVVVVIVAAIVIVFGGSGIVIVAAIVIVVGGSGVLE